MNFLIHHIDVNAVASWILAVGVFVGVLVGLLILKKQSAARFRTLADSSANSRYLSFIALLIGKTNI